MHDGDLWMHSFPSPTPLLNDMKGRNTGKGGTYYSWVERASIDQDWSFQVVDFQPELIHLPVPPHYYIKLSYRISIILSGEAPLLLFIRSIHYRWVACPNVPRFYPCLVGRAPAPNSKSRGNNRPTSCPPSIIQKGVWMRVRNSGPHFLISTMRNPTRGRKVSFGNWWRSPSNNNRGGVKGRTSFSPPHHKGTEYRS